VRLERLILHRFRCFYDAQVEFEQATLLIGPNNSGKSTVIDAIRSLYSEKDGLGRPFAYATSRTRLADAEAPGLDDAPSSTPEDVPFVVGVYGDLNEHERAVWEPYMDGDRLRFGTLFAAQGGHADRCLVMGANSSMGRRWREEKSTDTAETSGDEVVVQAFRRVGLRRSDQHGLWVSWSALGFFLSVVGQRADEAEALLSPVRDFPGPGWIVAIPGPEVPQPSAADLLRPLIQEKALSYLENEPESLSGLDEDGLPLTVLSAGDFAEYLHYLPKAVDYAIEDVESSFSTSLRRYLGQGASLGTEWRRLVTAMGQRSGWDVARRAIDALLDDLDVRVMQAALPNETNAGARAEPLSMQGAGAQRTAALAALDLYCNPDLVSLERSWLLLVEEPEVGLHPGLQRRVAGALHDLPMFGVQTVVVSHAPAFINAVNPAGIRVIRPETEEVSLPDGRRVHVHNHVVYPPRDLPEVAELLGCTPADVLLARTFVVVEGQSDAVVLSAWAHRLGCDLDRAGVRVVPAGGQGTAARVSQFLQLAYTGASFFVVLDNGPDTAKTKMTIEATHGDRVHVRLLKRTEIEAYYTPEAVAGWLTRARTSTDTRGVDEATIRSAVEPWPSKRVLRQLAERHLGLPYDVVKDGLAIANLMPEHAIDEDIKARLYEITAQ
jgi:energy-coupling factor transporter ATP-binding protein EcfA2